MPLFLLLYSNKICLYYIIARNWKIYYFKASTISCSMYQLRLLNSLKSIEVMETIDIKQLL